jgi:Fic family protein
MLPPKKIDGNGRIGRLMITLYLLIRKLITKPVYYLSGFFDRNRILYYDKLIAVRQHKDLKQRLLFFMSGSIKPADQVY